MRWSGIAFLLTLLILPALSGKAEYTCALPAAIEAELQALPAMDDFSLDFEQRSAPRREFAAEHPDNLLVHLRVQEAWSRTPWLDKEWDRLLAGYRAMSNRTDGLLLEASLLMDVEPQRSREMLLRILDRQPDHPWAHFVMIGWARGNPSQDPKLEEQHFREFRRLCPESIDVFRYSGGLTDPGLITRAAADGQRLLFGRTDDRALGAWPAVWRLMLDADPGDPAGTQARIRAQLQAVAALDKLDSRGWYRALQSGYALLGGEEAARAVEDRILAERAASSLAFTISIRRGEKPHERLPGGSPEERRAHNREVYQNAKAEHERWPNAPQPLFRMVTAVFRQDVALDEKLRVIDGFLEMASRYPDYAPSHVPRAKLSIAGFYTEQKIRLDRVPSLVEEALRTTVESMRYWKRGDPEGQRHLRTSNQDQAQRLMLRYYEVTEQPEKRKELAAELRKELDDRPGPGASQSEVRAYNSRLWAYRKLAQELHFPAEDLPPVQATEDAARTPIEPFEAVTAAGEPVSTRHWSGKATLVHVFATWCEECREQHHDLQKLYQHLAADPIRSVLAISIDRDIEVVRAYLEKNGFTFPVIVGREYAEKIAPGEDLPQNWIVDGHGNRVTRMVNYSGEAERSNLLLVMDRLQAQTETAGMQ